MSVSAHLLMTAFAVLAVVATVIVDWGPGNRRFTNVLLATTPVLLVAVICSLLMLAGKKPFFEWGVPFAGLVAIGLLCKHERVYKATKVIAPISAVILVLHFLNVAHREDSTNAPDVLERLSRQKESIAKKDASKELLSTFDVDQEFPAGPIDSILHHKNMQDDVFVVKRAYPEWHSTLSRLYRVESRRGVIWYPGGKVGDASGRLEVRLQ